MFYSCRCTLLFVLSWFLFCSLFCAANSTNNNDEEPHPDPNDENYENMIYIGRFHHDTGKRIGFDEDNGIKYIFGTSFDSTHKDMEEADLQHQRLDALHHAAADLANRNHPTKTREEVLRERRHKPVSELGPKPFGHVGTYSNMGESCNECCARSHILYHSLTHSLTYYHTKHTIDEHELDGGVVPPKVVHVAPFFLDATLVTNKQFGKFVRSTYYETEAEHYGWSFVLESFLSSKDTFSNENNEKLEVDPQAEHWVAVEGAYWRRPEGPSSTYKLRENHPVVHVSHKDAAEYCAWAGKRLPGEREWEAAARAGHWGPSNRTLYAWGEEDDWDTASQYANLWGNGSFPYENHAQDGWRGTSPVKHYPPNRLGFYDMTGNVWEWMRGGKHKKRIVRGGSYVDSLDGSFNHAATLGARATLHGTTTTGNVGFRCCKSPKRRTEYHYVSHDESVHGKLEIEDQYGKRMPQPGWEDVFSEEEDWEEMYDENDPTMVKPNFKLKKVIKKREVISSEL